MFDQNHDRPANPPAETIRDGSLKATIWRNEGEKGAYHTVNLARTYKDNEGNLRESTSFRAQDMLPLSELSRQAHYRANELNRAAFKERRAAEPEQTRTQSRAR